MTRLEVKGHRKKRRRRKRRRKKEFLIVYVNVCGVQYVDIDLQVRNQTEQYANTYQAI